MKHIWGGQLSGRTTLWRYMTEERFLSLLKTSKLYFPAAKQFEDPYEGCIAVQSPKYKNDPRYDQTEYPEKAFEELRRLTKINCWHCSEHENSGMWQIYANRGIAVCTTVDSLKKAIFPFRLKKEYGEEDLWGGFVRYVDLTKVRIKTGGFLRRFFIKHHSFSWESEFRLAISLRMAEEFGCDIPSQGICVPVDLKKMVNKIYFGPQISSKTSREILLAMKNAGLYGRNCLSSLCYKPRYI